MRTALLQKDYENVAVTTKSSGKVATAGRTGTGKESTSASRNTPSQNSANTLPSTGDKANTGLMMAGGVVLTSVGLIGLTKKKEVE